MKRFIITGCGRSGTQYMSVLLSRIGATCTHEAQFNSAWQNPDWEVPPYGESSGFAVPFISDLPAGTVLFHLVREPMAVLRSGLFKTSVEGTNKNSARFHARYYVPAGISQYSREENPVLYQAENWVKRNQLVLAARDMDNVEYHLVRIEDISAAVVRDICKRIGHKCRRSTIGRALRAVPRNTNTRGSTARTQVGWYSISDAQLRKSMVEMSRYFGYGPGASRRTIIASVELPFRLVSFPARASGSSPSKEGVQLVHIDSVVPWNSTHQHADGWPPFFCENDLTTIEHWEATKQVAALILQGKRIRPIATNGRERTDGFCRYMAYKLLGFTQILINNSSSHRRGSQDGLGWIFGKSEQGAIRERCVSEWEMCLNFWNQSSRNH